MFPEIQAANTVTASINGFGFAPPVLGRTLVGFTAIDTHLQIPRIEQASVSFERQIASNTMMQVGYLGAWGSSLDRSRLVNNAQPGPAACSRAGRIRRFRFVPRPNCLNCRRA